MVTGGVITDGGEIKTRKKRLIKSGKSSMKYSGTNEITKSGQPEGKKQLRSKVLKG